MHFSVRTPRAFVLGIALAFAVVGCASGVHGGENADATIGFATPTDGSTVSLPFDVELESSVPLGEPESGNHHAHLYFDTSTDSADYDIVYGTTWQVTRSLEPGEHTITVALANPDHSLAGPTGQITVIVGEDGGVSTPDDESPSAPGGEAPSTPPAGSPAAPGIEY